MEAESRVLLIYEAIAHIYEETLAAGDVRALSAKVRRVTIAEPRIPEEKDGAMTESPLATHSSPVFALSAAKR